MRDVYVLGVGAHPWGAFPQKSLLQLEIEATSKALIDAALEWRDIEAVVAASSHFGGGWSWGQHGPELLREVNESGIPAYNVVDACAVGGQAIDVGHLMVASGRYDIVMVVGAEKPPVGMLPLVHSDVERELSNIDYLRWVTATMANPVWWGILAQRRMEDFGTTELIYAKASELMHRNAIPNPISRFRKGFTVEEILNSAMVCYPLRVYELCATSDGAAALILCSAEEARKRSTKPVSLAGSGMGTTQFGDLWPRVAHIATAVKGVAKRPEKFGVGPEGGPYLSEYAGAAIRAERMAGLGPKDIDFLELQDNSSWHVVALPEVLEFCEPGQGDWMLEHGEFEINGKLPNNASGGLQKLAA